MKLPIIVNGKTLYMDFDDWKREKEWREESEKHFPNVQEHLKYRRNEANNS